jgi:hypothetical protein
MIDTPSVANVLSVYNGASAANLREGLSWYLDAHSEARSLAGHPTGPGARERVASAAGIIAALSPMNGWENNKNKARQLVAQNGDGTGCGLYRNVAKAVAIYNGADPLDVLGGDKVRAFYQTILDPFGDIDPVIDRHAFDIAVGERTDEKRRGILSRKGVYSEFAHVYREAAKVAGIGSAQMQAITWVAWREAIGVSHNG